MARASRSGPSRSQWTAEAPAHAVLARVAREDVGRLVAALTRVVGDFDLAEELVQEAIVSALERWPTDGVPDVPAAWLLTTARRKGIDRLRRESRYREKLEQLEAITVSAPSTFPDERLELLFACCHPAIAREAQLALTLRSVAGLTTGQIARAFLTSEATVAQRIVRAKRKIVDARIPLRVPEPGVLPDRLAAVLAVLYLVFNEGYLASDGDQAERRELCQEAEWLASLLVRLLSDEPEALGLLALMRIQLARADARFDERGRIVLLKDQDRSRWDAGRVADAQALIERAARMRRLGPYQLQAAIAAAHAEAATWDETDWPEILSLYDVLVALAPSPVASLNRAIALRYIAGAEPALRAIEALAGELSRYPYFHAARGELLRELGDPIGARTADARALELTSNPAERALLLARLAT